VKLYYCFRLETRFWNLFVEREKERYKVYVAWGDLTSPSRNMAVKRSNFQRLGDAVDFAKMLYMKRIRAGYIPVDSGVVYEKTFGSIAVLCPGGLFADSD
jgi:hypothetical protein